MATSIVASFVTKNTAGLEGSVCVGRGNSCLSLTIEQHKISELVRMQRRHFANISRKAGNVNQYYELASAGLLTLAKAWERQRTMERNYKQVRSGWRSRDKVPRLWEQATPQLSELYLERM